MDLALPMQLAAGYRSPSQRARRITEGWFAAWMYCPACDCDRLDPQADNTQVVDFGCPGCGAEFQLKAKGGTLGARLRDAAYQPMMARALAGNSPHFAFLQYRKADWRVVGLLLVPGHFITPNVIERCRPLSHSARRAAWVGCNILADRIPQDGRLPAVAFGKALPPEDVRRSWRQFAWLKDRKTEDRSWLADVLRCVRAIGKSEFTLQDVYEYEEQLRQAHPKNRNVQPKVRQQLQLLRNAGVIEFLDNRGRYRVLQPPAGQ